MHTGVSVPIFFIINFVIVIVIVTVLSINYSHQVKVFRNEVALRFVCKRLQDILNLLMRNVPKWCNVPILCCYELKD